MSDAGTSRWCSTRLSATLRGVSRIAVIQTVFVASGCISWSDSAGVRRTIVLGFGYVEVTEQEGVSVEDATTVGGVLSANRSGFGLLHRHVVAIDPNAAGDALLRVSSDGFSSTVEFESLNGEVRGDR